MWSVYSARLEIPLAKAVVPPATAAVNTPKEAAPTVATVPRPLEKLDPNEPEALAPAELASESIMLDNCPLIPSADGIICI